MKALLRALLFVLASSTTLAETFIVNLDTDAVDAAPVPGGACDTDPVFVGKQCSLRAAVMQANATPGEDVIELPLDMSITLTQAQGAADDASEGDLDITESVRISAIVAGEAASALDYPRIIGAMGDRLLQVHSGAKLTLEGARLENGSSGASGGALSVAASDASAVLRLVRLDNNFSLSGGAIVNSGQLTVERSDFLRNESSGDGTDLYNAGTAIIRRSSLRLPHSAAPLSESIYSAPGSTLTVENTLIDGATLAIGGTQSGGIHADHASQLIIRNSTFYGATSHVLRVAAGDGNRVRVFQSIIARPDGAYITQACDIDFDPGSSPSVVMADLGVNSEECADHVIANLITDPPLLQGQGTQANEFVTYRRLPFGSPLIDRGFDGLDPAHPERSCLSEDAVGKPRPLDGDGNGMARCDLGAHEASTLTSVEFLVDRLNVDAVDTSPGDGLCDSDAVAAGSQCTLRAAVMESNARPGPDRIRFIDESAVIVLNQPGAGGAAEGDLDITEQVSIVGPSESIASMIGVATNLPYRVFDIDLPLGQTIEIGHLILLSAQDTVGGSIRVQNAQRADLHDLYFKANLATGLGGVGGGAIASYATTQITRGHFEENTAQASVGSAIYAAPGSSLTITHSSLVGNESPVGDASIYVGNGASFSLHNSTLSHNSHGIVSQALHNDLRLNTIANNGAVGWFLQAGPVGQDAHLLFNVLTGHSGADCVFPGAFVPDENVSNWITDGSCASPSNADGDPRLAPLPHRDITRLTAVRWPLADSPLRDYNETGIALKGLTQCAGIESDQLGNPRPIDSDGDGFIGCDLGAIESSGIPDVFVVNIGNSDEDDLLPGDGVCNTSMQVGDRCTLRAAVMEANAYPGFNTINIADHIDTITLDQPELAGVSAAHGDLDLTEGTWIRADRADGAAPPVIQANGIGRVFSILSAGSGSALQNLQIEGGNSSEGGAIRLLAPGGGVELIRLRLIGNSAVSGGALAVINGEAFVYDTLFEDNQAQHGPAILARAPITLERSAVIANIDSDAALDQREAILVDFAAPLTMRNNTIAENNGSGVRVVDGNLSATSNTFSANADHAIRFANINARTLSLRNNAMAGNGGGACITQGLGSPTIQSDYNFIQTSGCGMNAGVGNIQGNQPGLGPLMPGDFTLTPFYGLESGSALIDAHTLPADETGCAFEDQHRLSRPMDGDGDGEARCDIGAIEFTDPTPELFMDSFE